MELPSWVTNSFGQKKEQKKEKKPKWKTWLNRKLDHLWLRIFRGGLKSREISKIREKLTSWIRTWIRKRKYGRPILLVLLLVLLVAIILLFLGIIGIKDIYLFELGIGYLLILCVFRFFVKDTRFTIDRLITILVILGVVVLAYLLLPDASYSLDYIFSKLGLEETGGYVVIGSIVGFTALLWGLGLRNRHIEKFSNQILEDRFIRSVDLTGRKELGIRLGVLAGLKALATENVEMYKRVWEYLGGFLRNPPDLDGWRSEHKEGRLYCRRIFGEDKIKPLIIASYRGENKDTEMGKRPDIAYIAQQIVLGQNEEQRRWKKDEHFRLPLYKAHLEGTDLRGAHLDKADLREAHLEGAELGGAHLEEADLRKAHLEGATLIFAHLEGADLREAHLDGADLSLARLDGAGLRGAHLDGAELIGAHLDGAKLIGAHLDRAVLIDAHLDGADLRRAHLDGAYLSLAHLEGADLRRAHLEGAVLIEAHLNEVDLSLAHLDRANLEGAHLNGSDLKDAHLDRANITLTDLSNTKNLTKEQLKTCWYYIDEDSLGRYGPPVLPKGWNVDEIGIQASKPKTS